MNKLKIFSFNLIPRRPPPSLFYKVLIVALLSLLIINCSMVTKKKNLLTEELEQEYNARSIYQQGLKLANDKQFDEALKQLQTIPVNTSYYSQIVAKTKEIEEAKGKWVYEEAYRSANKGDFIQAVTLMKEVPFTSSYYDKSQKKIVEWNKINVESEAKESYSYAQEKANSGDYETAINIATQIPSGTSVYSKAQADAKKWEKPALNQKGKEILDEAQNKANAGDYDDAVEVAKTVPKDSSSYSSSQIKIKEWTKMALDKKGQEILDSAQNQANSGYYEDAISTAKNVPKGSNSYSSARQKIQQWQGILNKQAREAELERQRQEEEERKRIQQEYLAINPCPKGYFPCIPGGGNSATLISTPTYYSKVIIEITRDKEFCASEKVYGTYGEINYHKAIYTLPNGTKLEGYIENFEILCN